MATNNTLNAYPQPTSLASVVNDSNIPLSFKDWYRNYTSITPGQEYNLYNIYLTQWYQNKQKENQDSSQQLRLTYLSLLRQLQIFATSDEAEKWYSEIDLENEKELITSIPYFARRLKDIALYYLQLREEVKKTKIKYNHIGSNRGLVQQLQELFLTNFTKKQDKSITLPANVWNSIPELSSVNNTLTITIEELYDDHHYGDQNTTLPVSAYYDLNNNDLVKYINSKNIPLSSTDWIYKQGNLTVTVQDILDNVELANKTFTKYIGEQKYIDILASTNVPLMSAPTDIYNLFINEGTNRFFWPYGAFKPEISTATRYKPLALTAANIENLGFSSPNIASADTIFVKTADKIEGAWLRFKPFEESKTDMVAYLEGGKQIAFKYPYPGFGLSSDDVFWTGPSIKYTPEYYYLEKSIKQLVDKEYWNLDVTLSGADSIRIKDTTLIKQGAFAGPTYNLSDKIRVNKNSTAYSDSVAYGNSEEAWLYKMTKTDIPIGDGNSLLVWPYQRISNQEPFPNYFPNDISTVCNPINLSAIVLPYATSSDSISGADVIYKLQKYTDNETQAVQCAWLSGAEFKFGKRTGYTGISQPGFNSIFTAGTTTKFLWEGPDNIDINDVFKSIQHQPDCTFVTSASSYLDHNLCTCRSVLFSPFGHPGRSFPDNNGLADYIVELDPVNEAPLVNPWTVVLNLTALTVVPNASALAFFRTNKKIGWGDGKWYSRSKFTNYKFYLRQGRTYMYSRAIAQGISNNSDFPFLISRYLYEDNKTRWIGAQKNSVTNIVDGVPVTETFWSSTDAPSDIVIQPGDIILYKKAGTTSYKTLNTFTGVLTPPTAVNLGSIWSNYDQITVGTGEYGTPQQVTVSYPTDFYPAGAFYDTQLSAQYVQYPRANYNNVLTVDWELTDPGGARNYFYDTKSFTFTPLDIGEHSVKLIAITANRIKIGEIIYPDNPSNRSAGRAVSGFYEFSNIPVIEAIDYSLSTVNVILTSYYRSVPGFVINIPLYGWNYDYNTANTGTNGAKPYWAAGNTTYKDIISWGASFRLVDSYNIVTQPFFSNIILETGNYIEYERKFFKSLTWTQPINYKIQVNENVWSTIDITTTATSNLEPILNNLTNQAIAIPTTKISPILLQNAYQNLPVEIYYKSGGSFVWTISAVQDVDNEIYRPNVLAQLVEPLRPWNNLTNRFNPSFNIFPALDNLYSKKEKGGHFTPENLGLSMYLNKDYSVNISVSSSALSSYFENPDFHVGGRSFTQEDQPSPFFVTSNNNIWLKEPIVAGPIAGTIKKNISKKYQKFLPYQSSYESNIKKQVGIIHPLSRQTPFGGPDGLTWTDLANKPQSFTGVVDVSAWIETQALKKQLNKHLDNWTTDIFGNQYGLYKNLTNVAPYNRKSVPGELWVRKNSQLVQPAKDALSAVFDSYINTPIINSLTGIGINKIDVFFDTLYIETTGAIILEDLDYNFDTNTIFSITDNSRSLSLAIPVTQSLVREITSNNYPLPNHQYAKIGNTWFLSQEKALIISTCHTTNGVINPELFKFDLNTKTLTKIFPTNAEDINSTQIPALSFDQILLSYDDVKNEFLLSTVVTNIFVIDSYFDIKESRDSLVEFFIKYIPDCYLKSATVYSPDKFFDLPPYLPSVLSLTAGINERFVYPIPDPSSTTQYIITDKNYDWITINNRQKAFIGIPPKVGDYYVPYSATNGYGTAYYSLNINVTA